jgi:hypothetical protein
MKSDAPKRPELVAMRQRLNLFLADDRESSLVRRLFRGLQDPLRPTTPKGRLRPNPIVLMLAAVALLTIGTFLIFSLGH